MKVVVYLADGKEGCHLLNFGRSVTKASVLRLLEGGENHAIEILLGYSQCLKPSQKIFLILPKDIEKAEKEADFILGAFSPTQSGYGRG